MSKLCIDPARCAERVVGLPPCKDCARRYVGCHSRCVDYLQWNDRRLAEKKKFVEANREELRDKRRGIAVAIIATTKHGQHQYRKLKFANALLRRNGETND